MAKFKLLGGSFVDRGRTYKMGDIIDSPTDLRRAFRCMFQMIEEYTAAPAPAAPVPEAPSTAPAEKGPTGANVAAKGGTPASTKPAPRGGKDVTKTFPLAVDEDFQVYKKGLD